MVGGEQMKYEINDEFLERVKRLVAGGYSNKEIADVLQVSERTFDRWIQKNERLKEAIQEGRLKAVDEFLKSAFSKLSGHKVYEEHIVEIYKPTKDGEKQLVRIERHIDEKYIPPDTTFMIFWAKNRLKEKFSDEQKMTINTTARFVEVERVYGDKKDPGKTTESAK